MIRKFHYLLLALAGLLIVQSCATEKKQAAEPTKPNVVVIYMDDLGYGDMSAYGATELSTPNMDRIANEGIRFTNGYATSATCTPSRYGLLTGVYPWRNKRAAILPGSAPMIIKTDQETLPKVMQRAGYQTAVIGKWHLGLGDGNMDWNGSVTPGPNQVGFDHSYILAATQDRVPTVYIDNGKVDGLDPNDPISVSYKENFEGEPTGKDNPELTTMKWHHGHNNSIVNGIPRIGYMKGGEAAKWTDTDMADHFLGKVKDYIKSHKDKPFFLYYAMQQPHVPRTPHPRFVGKSGMGPRGDVILEADWCIGEFMKTLEEEGILENTMIIFSSDNGPVLQDGYYDDAEELVGNHKPAGALRGGKYSLFEAGSRVPFMTYWKGTIEPGVSDALVCQIDLLASLASMNNVEAVPTDSKNFLDVFLGKSQKGRDFLVEGEGRGTALRAGDWVMIPPYRGAAVSKNTGIELGKNLDYQLYNLKEDIGQQNNLAEANPEKLQELIAKYEEIRGVKTKKLEPKKKK
ncbi:sulfatase family protein [Reichenbachiella versicolor]|uniref:sulfatase family protein n=1 Tax=Reichenbachiella versicolor TaxID=1821036 RepID=UPI000D6DE020|nr:arylsulfatase [Reichenbachiella versicolor]